MVGKPSFSHHSLYKPSDGFFFHFIRFSGGKEKSYYFKFWYDFSHFEDFRSRLNSPQFPFLPSVDVCVHIFLYFAGSVSQLSADTWKH